MWPMEKYISTTRKPRDQNRRFFKSGVSLSFRLASSPGAAFVPALCRPFWAAP